MTKVLKGKIRGATIELTEGLSLPDGLEVEVEIRVSPLGHLERAFGGWAEDPELDRTLEQLERERHEAKISPS